MKSSILVLLFTLVSLGLNAQQLQKIPSQTIDLFQALEDTTRTYVRTINAFEVSDFITYKEYKIYLSSIQQDSSESFCKSQLPDKNIALNEEIYNEYLSGYGYDDYPVLGISWDNAMHFCKWKTLTEQSKDSLSYIYRLPTSPEWLSAKLYLEENGMENDLNRNYSDWLLNPKDESLWSGTNESEYAYLFDDLYFHKKDDPLSMKRKVVIGNSYLYQQEKLLNYYLFSHYATEGYRQIGFRYVKDPIEKVTISTIKGKFIAAQVLTYWNLSNHE